MSISNELLSLNPKDKGMSLVVLPGSVDLNEVMAKTQWNRSLKKVRMNRNIMGNILKYCRSHIPVDSRGVITNKRTCFGGNYYALIVEQANKSGAEGLLFPPGLPCYECRELIPEGQVCIRKTKSNGKKYLHPACAYRINII